jgi:hypothetical protein
MVGRADRREIPACAESTNEPRDDAQNRVIAADEMMPSPTAILTSLLVALAATLGTLVIHGLVVHTIIMTLRRDLKRGRLGARIWVNLSFILGATLLAFFGHLVEIALWAIALQLSGAVADIGAAFYSSAGSYTTSGSDIILPPQWKLMGPFEAVCGMLMFGVTTAFIFAVIQRLIRARYEDADNFLP